MSNRNLIPAGHRVLVQLRDIVKEKEVKSDGGIIMQFKDDKILQAEQYATQEAYVLKLGINAFKAFDSGEQWCKEGDLVLIAKYSGDDRTDIEDGKVCRIINDEDIIAVFKGEGLND